MSKKLLSVIIALVVVIATFIPMTASAAVVTPVADASEFNTVVDGWFIAPNGGYKFYVDTWQYYGAYGLALVENPSAYPTNACAIAVYAADDEAVFEAKTKADFESVLSETVTTFTKTTVGNAGFTMYYAETSVYENYVFQAHGHKYFINFIYGTGDRAALKAFAASVMETIVIADDIDAPILPEKYDIVYKVDGVEYARETYEVGATITPVAAPEKEGYEFSGWSEIPEVMPAEEVTVEGTFTEIELPPIDEDPLNPPTGDNTMLAVAGAALVLAFVAIVASKKRASAR